MTTPRIFHAADRTLVAAVTPSGTTRIAREIGADRSRHIGAGIEVFEDTFIDWTVTYDEVIFVHAGELTITLAGETHHCGPGDIIWLPEGTGFRMGSATRAEVFYALHPVDWAARQGLREP
ncbi:MAG: cupin domain-containing protein [Rubellimicrobium sp.]|nr:cupin domain-containing protein [Rubellimicrobium sp.]